MTESNNDSTPRTTTRVYGSDCLLRVPGELHAHGGSDETLSEANDTTQLEILGESSKNELTPRASDTHFIISPASSTFEAGSQQGEDKEFKKSTVQMLLLYTAIGTIFAVGHHVLYETLSHHLMLAVSLQIGPVTVGPMWALTVGNGLSWLVQLFFTLAIGRALVQQFWNLVHKHHFTLHEMDRIFSITSAFYTKTALRRATGFTMVALLFLILGGIISTFAPASLAISIYPLSQPCDIMTVELSNTRLGGDNPTIPLRNLAARVLLTQSTKLPTSSPCSNCTYNVTYFAPAMTCEEINMASSPFPPDPVDRVVLWNGTFASNDFEASIDIYILSRRMGNFLTGVFSDPEIIMCTLKNATYQVTVDHRNGTSVTAEMDIVPFFNQSTGSDNITVAYSSIGQAFVEFILGYAALIPSQNYTPSFNTFMAFTGWITCDHFFSSGNCTRNVDLLTAFPILMQYMSVSLLAESVAADNTTSSLSRVPDGRCLNESPVYIYDRVRLLSVYGSALLVTSICVAMGIHSVVVGQGSTLMFSNLVYAIMSPEMIEISNGQKLPQDTVIRAVKGRLLLAKYVSYGISIIYCVMLW
ncbi:hypothetical protein BD410DRAFT_828532 [Rickenella mellea]|uniref:Transmembrane protein n=1 Tax=Rickenella mellea TaxID=50990 RepID=A0A4Y7Q4E8_9AGAM|nr:hypothetical protein BD410DRAFT_828532 [Rickenella mellea]